MILPCSPRVSMTMFSVGSPVGVVSPVFTSRMVPALKSATAVTA